MKILEEIADGYRKLFDKTGNPKFFVLAQNVNKLNADIMGVDLKQEINTEPELSV